MYAIGEVLIVIIGILLAIQINNWNQHRQAEFKINRLLLHIKNNLPDEIESAESIINWYDHKDTLLTRIKQRKVTRQEFNSPSPWSTLTNPQWALFDYGKGYSLNKNAYNNLVLISDQIPAKYDSLYMALSRLYIDVNDLVNERELKLLDKYYTLKAYLTQNKDFYSELWQPKDLSDNAIDYFMNDPIYLNWVYEIDAYYRAHKLSLINFVEYATMVLNQIDELELRVD
jgi:hypothetical protein